MAISVLCRSCMMHNSLPDAAAGKKERCKNCGEWLQVPAPNKLPLPDRIPGLDLQEEAPVDAADDLTPLDDDSLTAIEEVDDGLTPLDAADGLTPLESDDLAAIGDPSRGVVGASRTGPTILPSSGGDDLGLAPLDRRRTIRVATKDGYKLAVVEIGPDGLPIRPPELWHEKRYGGYTLPAIITFSVIGSYIGLSLLLIPFGGLNFALALGFVLAMAGGFAWAFLRPRLIPRLVVSYLAVAALFAMVKGAMWLTSRGLPMATIVQPAGTHRQGHHNGMPDEDLPQVVSTAIGPWPDTGVLRSPTTMAGINLAAPRRQPLQASVHRWQVEVDPIPAGLALTKATETKIVIRQAPEWDAWLLSRGNPRFVAVNQWNGTQRFLEAYDLETGKKIGELIGDWTLRDGVAYSIDGKHIAYVDMGHWEDDLNRAHVLSFADGTEIRTLTFGDRDIGRYLAFVGRDRLFIGGGFGDWQLKGQIWDLRQAGRLGGMSQRTQPNEGAPVYSPGQRFLAVRESNASLQLVDLRNGQIAGEIMLERPWEWLGSPSFSPDGRLLGCLCRLRGVPLQHAHVTVDVATGRVASQRAIDGVAGNALADLDQRLKFPAQWLAGNTQWLVGGRVLIDRERGQLLGELSGDLADAVDVRILNDQQLLVARRTDEDLVLSVEPLPEQLEQSGSPKTASVSLQGPVVRDPDLGNMQTMSFPQGEVPWQWRPEREPVAVDWNGPLELGPGFVTAAHVVPTVSKALIWQADPPEGIGGTVAGVDPVGTLRRYDLGSGSVEFEQTLIGTGKLADVSQSAGRVVFVSGQQDERLDVWDLSGEAAQHVCGFVPFASEDARLSQTATHGTSQRPLSARSVTWVRLIDDEHLLTRNHDTGRLVLWSIPDCKAVWHLAINRSVQPALSPSRRHFAVMRENALCLFDSRSCKAAGRFELPFAMPVNVRRQAESAITIAGGRLLCATTLPDIGEVTYVLDGATGQVVLEVPAFLNGACWLSPERLVTMGQARERGEWILVDLERMAAVWRYSLTPGFLAEGSTGDLLFHVLPPSATAGRPQASLELQPFVMDGRIENALAALPRNPQPLFGRRASVSLDLSAVNVDGAPAGLSQQIARHYTEQLKARGIQVVEGAPVTITAAVNTLLPRVESYQQETRIGGSVSRQTLTVEHADLACTIEIRDRGQVLWRQHRSPIKGTALFEGAVAPLADSDAHLHKVYNESRGKNLETFLKSLKFPPAIYRAPHGNEPPLGTPHGTTTPKSTLAAERIALSLPGIEASLPRLPQQGEYVPGPKRPKPLSRYERNRLQSQGPTGNQVAEILNEVLQMRRAAFNHYGSLATLDDEEISQQWQWCETLGRPVHQLRWGVGVQYDKTPETPRLPSFVTADALDPLRKETGELGPTLVNALASRTTSGKFGDFSSVQDKRLSQLILLGSGSRTDLGKRALLLGLDAVALLHMQGVGQGRTADIHLTVSYIDIATGKTFWQSEVLSLRKFAEAKQAGRNLDEELAKEAVAAVDEKLVFVPLDEADRAKILARAQVTTDFHRANPIASLAEAQLHRVLRTASSDVLNKANLRVIGNLEDAQALHATDAAKRDAIVKKYLDRLAEKLND